MSWKEEMEKEVTVLSRRLRKYRSDIQKHIDGIEKGKSERDKKKKEMMLREMKRVLSKLENDEKKVVADLKSEAFDLGK